MGKPRPLQQYIVVDALATTTYRCHEEFTRLIAVVNRSFVRASKPEREWTYGIAVSAPRLQDRTNLMPQALELNKLVAKAERRPNELPTVENFFSFFSGRVPGGYPGGPQFPKTAKGQLGKTSYPSA
jgi:hypothetical protein